MWSEVGSEKHSAGPPWVAFGTERGTAANGATASRCIIEETISQVFGISRGEIRLETRGKAPSARARQVAMYLAHVGLGMTMQNVGKLFSRDRTTVAHACCVIEDCREDPMFDRVLELLEWAIVARIVSHRFGRPGRT